ncbi:MAG: hypothetical protein HOC23_11420 [Halieaceae bacterium]|jgi:hypothetical protein|nr:hypothetical protein [Halieaceae bacterium]
MAGRTDIVSLKWVIGLMNKQAEIAEAALVDYSKEPGRKRALLQCMWAIHQITSTLRALGIKKGELLSVEMERSLNALYKEKVVGERRKLTMGGLMQALKVLPAYLAHTQTVRQDTGRGLEPYVNDLRRWVGERPRPQAFFFHMDIAENVGITADAKPASDDEIKSRANVMLALYLEMAKSALRKRNVGDSMKTVARIARKMQLLFSGTETERFWLVLVGICEGIAGGLIIPDECIAQVFKAGAFTIKYARENGAQIDPSADYNSHLQHMLYYIASSRARPVHIANIRDVFGINENTVESSSAGLVHIDALITALSGALEQLNGVVDYITSNDLTVAAIAGGELDGTAALDGIEGAQDRLSAAGQEAHAESLQAVHSKLRNLYNGTYSSDTNQREQVINGIVRGIVDVKLDLEYKLEHGVCSSFYSKEFELRESVVSATFTQMGLVEDHLHVILRRKALANALEKRPQNAQSLMNLTLALHRYLNKSDQGHKELRAAVNEADNGEVDIDWFYDLAKKFCGQLQDISEAEAIGLSTQLLSEISGALTFAGMEREGLVIEQCRRWLIAAGEAQSVQEDEAFRCFADAFAQIELHLQRSVLDPLDDTSHMLAFAEQRAGELDNWIQEYASGVEVIALMEPEIPRESQNDEIYAEYHAVFIEESEELVADLTHLFGIWTLDPEPNHYLRDMRRHFHTFKGNGRAVGANTLGELGWAAQDLLDHILNGDLKPGDEIQALIAEVITTLPALVASCKGSPEFDVSNTRALTERCFRMTRMDSSDLADSLPKSEGAVNPTVGIASQLPVVETVGH